MIEKLLFKLKRTKKNVRMWYYCYQCRYKWNFSLRSEMPSIKIPELKLDTGTKICIQKKNTFLLYHQLSIQNRKLLVTCQPVQNPVSFV